MNVSVFRCLAMVACGATLACNGDTPPGGAGTGDGTGTTGGDATASSSDGGADTTRGGGTEGATGDTTEGMMPDLPDPGPDPNDDIPPPDEEGCHAIYAQDLLPTFEITVHAAIWEQLQDEWNNGAANEELGINPNPYHSLVEFRYEDIVIDDAAIRLKGNPTYWDPLPGDKMQFQIGFHTQDPDGRFLGIKRLSLDAATFNRHFMRERLSFAIMRKAGIRAPCANNARLVVNGEYYGLFTNTEKLDEIFLERTMEDPSGDLWKRANWELKTNETMPDETRLDAMRDATTIEELGMYLDIEQALRVYAAEAVMPDSDGAWAGGLNFYMYDDPASGLFMLLPWDKDNGFERFNDPPDGEYPINPDPVVWEKVTTHGRPFYTLALADPVYFDMYIGLIDEIVQSSYQPADLLAWIDEWAAQIDEAATTDTNKPYDNDTYYRRLDDLREYVQVRYDYLVDWQSCWNSGGTADAEGYCVPP